MFIFSSRFVANIIVFKSQNSCFIVKIVKGWVWTFRCMMWKFGIILEKFVSCVFVYPCRTLYGVSIYRQAIQPCLYFTESAERQKDLTTGKCLIVKSSCLSINNFIVELLFIPSVLAIKIMLSLIFFFVIPFSLLYLNHLW